MSLFSGLNNLKDITLEPRYSAICGYTDPDLDTVFAPELPGLDRDEIRRWYNGYGWLGGGRGEGLQPVRHPPSLRQPPIRRLVVRDRHARRSWSRRWWNATSPRWRWTEC